MNAVQTTDPRTLADPPAPTGTTDEATTLLERHPLPEPTSWWRAAWASSVLMPYHRLAVVALVANVAVAVAAIAGPGVGPELALGSAVVNLTVAALLRQQHVVNVLFRLATAAPTSWPLSVRRALGKVYHFGGLHVGANLAATAWFGAYCVLVLRAPGSVPPVQVAATIGIVAVALGILAFTPPRVRARHHDLFEVSHRFGGWLLLGLLWVHTVAGSVAGTTPLWAAVALGAVTLSVAWPWLRLRRVPVDVTKPSDHVLVLGFDHGVTPFAGSSTTVARRPLGQWHSFANIASPGRSGFRLTVSRAGDWTGDLVDRPPQHLWVRGVPTAGVGNIDQLFSKVVWVATGSGIGPCLPHLLARTAPARLVWATRSPARTYGDALVEEIRTAQPDAVVWDTRAHGKPDLAALAWAVARDCGAEAVICISNKPTTWDVVSRLEARGMPAYGAIWDS
ncbi:hypothetical protein [Isoptericola croceus]|uniref:hypothetical protein n=1 Tax=Isoptericola croceus TaxID=3031406 RepID=UPI0023F6C347|nr:hypothetical protein [Isoptericola croceus]